MFGGKKPSLKGLIGSLALPTEIIPRLYLSSKTAANHSETLRQYGITHILGASHGARAKFEEELGIKYLIINDLNDTVEDSKKMSEYISVANRFIHESLTDSENNRVLVHCQAGVSRSVTLISIYLITITADPWETVLAHIRKKRFTANPNPGFRSILSSFELSGDADAQRENLDIKKFYHL